MLSRGDYHWQHEPCFYAVRSGGKGHWNGDRKQTTLWHIPSRDQEEPRGPARPPERRGGAEAGRCVRTSSGRHDRPYPIKRPENGP